MLLLPNLLGNIRLDFCYGHTDGFFAHGVSLRIHIVSFTPVEQMILPESCLLLHGSIRYLYTLAYAPDVSAERRVVILRLRRLIHLHSNLRNIQTFPTVIALNVDMNFFAPNAYRLPTGTA